LFNEAGPYIGAMEVMIEIVVERIAIVKGSGTEADLIKCKLIHTMSTFLETKGRDT
jgi:hypothetical protein